MTFAEKLDFLMNITKVSNSALARSVSLDASYISRLRNGKRLMPKDSRLIQGVTVYLACRFTEGYQKKALSDALSLTNLPGDSPSLAEEIAHWLLHDRETDTAQVGRFLSGLSRVAGCPAQVSPAENRRLPFPTEPVSIYYGIEGKRQAAEYFLTEVATRDKPQTLLLFSDEGTSWMTDDPAFARRWAELMALVLARGNQIKIIHTVNRSLDEMLSAISQWMPLYMSGSIEPFFYPKKRDGIFRNTRFIAPETAAVVSNSVGDQVSVAANMLYHDREAVASFAQEFLQYLHLCHPLVRIFTNREEDELHHTLVDFERAGADTMIKTESLSLLTMPAELLGQMLRQSGMEESYHASSHGLRHQVFLTHLQSRRFTEIISLPNIDAVIGGAVKVSLSDMQCGGAVYYTPEAFAAHLEQVVSLLDSYKNYYVHLIDKPMEDGYMVYAREALGVIVAKTSTPPVILSINESNISAAFWDFLKDLSGDNPYAATEKTASISAIRDYLAKLKDALQQS